MNKSLNKHKKINGVLYDPYFAGMHKVINGFPPLHKNQRCTMTPMEIKMDKVKTVMHEGNVYDLDGIYLANDIGSGEGNLWTTIRLISINSKSTHPFRVSDREGYKYITVIRSPQTFGTITPAPVPLIHGKAYTFDCDNHSDAIGLFSKGGGLFLIHDGAVFNACFCTNIRPMAVVESSKTDE